MSSFIAAAQPQNILTTDDKRAIADEYSGWEVAQPPLLGARHRDNGDGTTWIADWRSPWWPAPSALLLDGGLYDTIEGVWYQDPYPVSGSNGRLGFNGIARDQYGSPITTGATVLLIRTSTNEIVAAVTADANGAYIVSSPYSGAHIIVVTNATVGGASPNTLLPG